MASFVPDQIYRLEANASYFKGRPKVDAIDLPIVKDQSAAFAALQTGQVDSVDRSVPPELFEQMSNQPGVKVVQATRMESVHLHFNNRKGAAGQPCGPQRHHRGHQQPGNRRHGAARPRPPRP